MRITRAQVDQVKTILGLDKDLTHSLTISPHHVLVQTVALVDGHPDVRDGLLGMDYTQYDIEEDTDDGDTA